MTLDAATATTLDAVESIFDFSRPASAIAARFADPSAAELAADRPDPEAGWASRNPDRAMLFLFVTPRDCAAVDELLAL